MKQFSEWLKARRLAVRTGLASSRRWLRRQGMFYIGSATVHVLVIGALLSCVLRNRVEPDQEEHVVIDTTIEPQTPTFELGTPPVMPSELSAKVLATKKPPAETNKTYSDAEVFVDAGGGASEQANGPKFGGLGGFEVAASGDDAKPASGDGGVGIGIGSSDQAGSGGSDYGFGAAGEGHRAGHGDAADQLAADRAVAAALDWLYRHQHADGSWSFTGFAHHCRDGCCTGASGIKSDVAATSLALLTSLAASQNNKDGPYTEQFNRALEWLVSRQQPSGSFAGDEPERLFTQSTATLALSEAFAVTNDQRIGFAAQNAVRALELIPVPEPAGWCCLAIASAEQAGLNVNPLCANEAQKWLDSLEPSRAAQPVELASSAIDAATPADWSADPLTSDRAYFAMLGRKFQHDAAPTTSDWDAFNIRMRHDLIAAQAKLGCATGSWTDAADGRLLATCIAALELAASYEHLPMYRPRPMSPSLVAKSTWQWLAIPVERVTHRNTLR